MLNHLTERQVPAVIRAAHSVKPSTLGLEWGTQHCVRPFSERADTILISKLPHQGAQKRGRTCDETNGSTNPVRRLATTSRIPK
jgi:hypothetical protein